MQKRELVAGLVHSSVVNESWDEKDMNSLDAYQNNSLQDLYVVYLLTRKSIKKLLNRR